jgi:hypothetical protein
MTTKNSNAKSALITLCRALVSGVQALPDPTFLLGGQAIAKAAVVAPLQAYVDAAGKTAADEATWHIAVQAEQAAEATARAMIDLLKPTLQGRLGKSNPQLQTQFGLTPAKKAQPSVAVKAKSAAKGTATRRQKKAAVAAVTAPVSPAAAAPAPAAPATPAKPTA